MAAAAAILLVTAVGAGFGPGVGRAPAQTATSSATPATTPATTPSTTLSTTPSTTLPGPALRVSVYGDSVLLGAKEELLAEFDPGQATVDAVEDRSLLGAIGLFQNAGPALGDVVVLDLGYNDASDPAVFRERIDGAMSALAGAKRVIWLDQHDWGPGRAGMNAELAAAATRYPTLDVVDWNAEVNAHPDDVYADAIHLTPTGQTAMATVVRQHYDRYVASLTPTTTRSTPATTGATVTSSVGSVDQAAPAAGSDEARDGGSDGGIDPGVVALAGAIVLVVVVTGLWVATRGRRAQRRARRRAERRGRRVSAAGRDRPGATPDP